MTAFSNLFGSANNPRSARPRAVTRITVALAILLVVSTLALNAQTVTGTITGSVTDPTAAAIPDVRIAAISLETNLRYQAQSNSIGSYTVPFLPIGNYRVEAEAEGFKRSVLGPFQLEAAQTARVNIQLELGEVTESIEITGVAPILQTEDAQTGGTITANQAASLPLQGRNFTSLTLLVPGSVAADARRFDGVTTSGRPFVNGNREQTNNFLVDGADSNSTMSNGIGYAPSVEALAEVKVLTGNASAEFGNSNGTIVNMALKSGTNQFHGSLFEYLRNDNLDANGFFLNRAGAKKQTFQRNVFGGTVGGPIVRDRHFFFFDYQGARERTSGSSLASVVPAEMRAGNLSRITRSVRDPLTGNPFPNNQIPAARITNPVASTLFGNSALYPLPTQAGAGAIGVTNNYTGSLKSGTDRDQFDIKIDSRLSDKDNLSGRFSREDNSSETTATALPTILGSFSGGPGYNSVLTWTRTINPSTVNEARIAFHRGVSHSEPTDPTGLLGLDGNSKLGIPGGQPVPGASRVVLGDGFTDIGNAATNSSSANNNFQYANNLSMQRGRHFLKMGVQFLRYQNNHFYPGNNGMLGFFTFDGTYTGSPYGDFLLNQLRNKGRGSVTGKWGHRQWRNAVFVQDDFKLAQNFTLNLGLRWEYSQPIYEVADRQTNVDLGTGAAQLAGRDGNSRALYEPYYKQFMPRLGFAWTPGILSDRLVIRGGYGVTSFLEGSGANLRLPLNPPLFFESDITYDSNAPGDITRGFTDALPRAELAGQVRAWNPDLKPALVQQWNLTFEYQFSPTFSLSAAYVGQAGRHLIVATEYNQPLPGTGPVESWAPLQQRRLLYSKAPLITNISGTDSSSNTAYNSLQFSGRKRMSAGLEFVANYTLSQLLTDNRGFFGQGAALSTEGAYYQNTYDRRGDWGPGFFDARHLFSLGGTYEIPIGRQKAIGTDWGGAANAILGGWKLGYMINAHSGFPVTILHNDVSRQAVRGFTRPDRYRPLNITSQTIDNWFGASNTYCATPGVDDGTCAYGSPALGKFGNSQKGTEREPSFGGFDLSIGKQFPIKEFQYIEFRANLYNAFNHPNFGRPSPNVGQASTFGLITTQVNSPRSIELALRFVF
jgi:outer membrane receptor protein involved in Fe transport